MSTTATSFIVMQGSKRGESSKKSQNRLPTIAPKDDVSSSASSSRSATASGNVAPASSRSRLPPRSRTGCWTCRTRKVKCDEGRPICGQCSRLGHMCDYSPRLSFRDDTKRVVERMQDVSTLGSTVWDPASPRSVDGGGSSSGVAEDTLPPFADLTTDEERERKAEAKSPGTFHVVVKPESFAHLPEYSEDVFESPMLLSATRRASLAYSLTSSVGRDPTQDSVIPTEDPNTVIVGRFDDTSKRPAYPARDPRLSTSPILVNTEIKPEIKPESDHSTKPIHAIPPHTPTITVGAEGPDAILLDHFRQRVWPQLAQLESCIAEIDRTPFPGEDIVEQIAALFTPCYHALMAVAATSLAHQNGEQRLEALQHYQQVLPALQNSLRSAEDLSSDGTFLTHFLLLVYEIAAAESGGSNLWSQHLTQLLRITLMRRDVLGGERFPFITWWICNIDLYALFSGAGSGDFIETMLQNDMMPPPGFHLCPLGMDGSSVVYREEADTLPLLLQLNYEVTVLAGRLGLLARDLRKEAAVLDMTTRFVSADVAITTTTSVSRLSDTARVRQRRIFEIQEALRQLWNAPNSIQLKQSMDTLPPRARQVLEHASALYRACIIYSHTSMWSNQRLDTGSESETEIAVCVQEILKIAEAIVNESRLGLRFIMFPLFMAGVASSSGSEKMMALDLMSSMEKESIGTNTTATKHILSMVFQQQTQRFMSVGHSLDVNWMDVMIEQGLQVVSFGI